METNTWPGRVRPLWRAARLLLCSVALAISACGGGGGGADPLSVTTEAGPSPFISMMHLQGTGLSSVTAVAYTIAPMPGTVSKPVHVEYSITALQARGYATSDTALTVPIIGLYAGYENQVAVQLLHADGTVSNSVTTPISTAPYTYGLYSQPDIQMARAAGSELGFDFIYIKSALGSPVIIDTDAQIRWVTPGAANSVSSTLVGDQFVIGDETQPVVHRIRMDGSVTQDPLPAHRVLDFNHDIEHGKSGLLAEVDGADNGVTNVESNVIEMTNDSANTVLNHWDLAAILSDYMSAHGDDPTQFVRPGIDWFHSNSAIYDPSDDTLIVSSRENFIMKVDYATHALIWILGDPTKYWYTFASLRAKALALAPGGLYPIGQHALSFTSDGLLMVFNDGAPSINQPAGQPAGQARSFSTVSVYSIDAASMTAQNVWNYQAGVPIYSGFCSSVYEAPGHSLLVDYAYVDDGSEVVLVGLDSNHRTVFSFEYSSTSCDTSWNAHPIGLEDLRIEQ